MASSNGSKKNADAPLEHGLSCQAFSQWLTTDLGQYLLARESQALKAHTLRGRGYQFAFMGEPAFSQCLSEIGIVHQVCLHPLAQVNGQFAQVACLEDQIPLQAESIEALYLPHCLERAHQPIQVLSEAYRILAPQGYLIISGFAPMSMWGVWLKVLSWCGRAPWPMKAISQARIKAWLAVLGFDEIKVEPFLFGRPSTKLQAQAAFEQRARRYWPFFNGAYIIIAQKNVVTLTPIRPDWTLKTELLSPLREANPN